MRHTMNDDDEDDSSTTPIFQHPDVRVHEMKLKQVRMFLTRSNARNILTRWMQGIPLVTECHVLGKNGDGKCGELALFYRDLERPAKDTGLVARSVCAKSGMSASTLKGGLLSGSREQQMRGNASQEQTGLDIFDVQTLARRVPGMDFGSGDFTISLWLRFTRLINPSQRREANSNHLHARFSSR